MKESDKIRARMRMDGFSKDYQIWLNVRSGLMINTFSDYEKDMINTAHDLIHKALERNIHIGCKIERGDEQ